MVARSGVIPFNEDPRGVLGVGPDATDEDIRQAYLRKVKAHPPDRDPEAFERIRDAYELLRDPRRRAALILLAPDPTGPLTDLLRGGPQPRKYVGPEQWLEVIREGAHRG